MRRVDPVGSHAQAERAAEPALAQRGERVGEVRAADQRAGLGGRSALRSSGRVVDDPVDPYPSDAHDHDVRAPPERGDDRDQHEERGEAAMALRGRADELRRRRTGGTNSGSGSPRSPASGPARPRRAPGSTVASRSFASGSSAVSRPKASNSGTQSVEPTQARRSTPGGLGSLQGVRPLLGRPTRGQTPIRAPYEGSDPYLGALTGRPRRRARAGVRPGSAVLPTPATRRARRGRV